MTKLIEGSPNLELTNTEKARRKLWKKSTAATGILLTLVGQGIIVKYGCDTEPLEPPITEGVVYKKEYIEEHIENDMFMAGDSMFYSARTVPEKFEIQIAQCPQGEIPVRKDKIREECKTNLLYVPKGVYNSLQIGQRADLKQYKSNH